MRRGHRAILHSGIALITVTLLGFAVAFAIDAALVNRTYGALRADHVAVKATNSACYFQPIPRRNPQLGPPNMCQLRFLFAGHTYTAIVSINAPKVLLVDPRRPDVQMTESSFVNGPTNINGDVVISSLLGTAALAITIIHQRHLHQRRRTRRMARP